MSDEAGKPPEPALVVRKQDLRPRAANGMLVHRIEAVRVALARQLKRDVDDIAMSQYAFMDDLELATVFHKGRRLTKRQQRVAREWEKSKREAPVMLLAAHERMLNLLRSQTEQKTLSINVEKAVIRVPDTRDDSTEDAVIIDAESNIVAR